MQSPGGTRTRPSRRRWWIAAAVAAGLAGLVVIGLLVVYPRVAARAIRDKLTSRIGDRLGRQVAIGEVDVRLGHATIKNLELRGPADRELPLVHVDRIDVEFDAWPSLIGRVRLGAATVDGVTITVRRDADGHDNVRDLIDRLAQRRARAGGGGRGSLPTSIEVRRIRLLADDVETGATVLVADGDASWRPGELIAHARELTATTIAAPKASAKALEVRKIAGEPPVVKIEGGELALWPKLALTGIGGQVAADPAHPGEYTIDLAGGYGGVPGRLWTARGPLRPASLSASLDLEAEKFQLDRLKPILARTPVVDYASTSVDTKLHLEIQPGGGKFAGEFHLHGLNIGHWRIADKEVRDLDLAGKVAGTFDRKQRRLELERGDFVSRGVAFSVTGAVAKPPRAVAESPDGPATAPARSGPGGIQLLSLRFVIPTVDCQKMLNAIPPEMVPYMQGYKLRGMFDADIALDIDWAKLHDLVLDGHVGLKHCRVVDQPADSPKRLKEEFEHYVEVEEGKWYSFIVGPTNEDFVPFEDISPYLVKSIMSTEDSAFYFHKGFITKEFRSALIKDLEAGAFRYGASSITMQMVKNVLLYRDKTLARKLQELFLTWLVEQTLTKDRILEIYFNVIEYGPGLYGIGPATRHYFGKEPKDLNPVEAAFFSTILPSPKERYKQYCAGTLTRWTEGKIDRILAIMLKRERLTQAEYDQATITPLAFVKDGTETEQECLKRTRKAIKNAVSTNPLKK